MTLKKPINIITHGGSGAHRDEYYAISLLMGLWPEKKFIVQRRNPTEDELNDPETFIIDIGGRYEPAMRNFDHHQDLNLPASLTLIAKYFDLDKRIKKAYDWWEYVDLVDRFGISYLEENRGINLKGSSSPIDTLMLKRFADRPNHQIIFMKELGKHILNGLYHYEERMSFYSECAIISIDKNLTAVINYGDDTSWLDKWMDEHPELNCRISISKDKRNEDAWAIYRRDDIKDILDLSFLSELEDTSFAHKGGFYACLKREVTDLKAAEIAIKYAMKKTEARNKKQVKK